MTPAYVPSLVLPAKVTIQIDAPLDWSQYGPEAARDPATLRRCYDQITRRMQRTMDALAREHPHPVLERLNELRPINLARRWWGAEGSEHAGRPRS